MGKGKATREMILSKAAALFNSRGYYGASMADLMSATGLEKGGIYNHFSSKDQLALEAFEFAFQTSAEEFSRCMSGRERASDKLFAFIEAFENFAANSPIPGGCPLLNSAVESDDGHPEMKLRVQIAMDSILATLEKLIGKGISEGELKPSTNAQQVARSIVAALEGGIMLAKLYSDTAYMDSVAETVRGQIRAIRVGE